MNKMLVSLAALAAINMFALAGADTPNANNNCAELVPEDEATASAADMHVSLAGGTTVWQESNGIAGLQTHEHTCRVLTFDADGKRTCGTAKTPACEQLVIAADTPVL